MLRALFGHVSTYSFGNLLVTLASFISFPILTRIFTVSDYGVLNLISATLLLLTGIGKLGVQQSIARFYGEVQAGRSRFSESQYYSTVLFGMAGIGLLVALLWAGASQIIPSSWWSDGRVQGLLLLTSTLIVVRVSDSGLTNLLRAEQRSGLYGMYAVGKKYVGLGIILVTLFYFSRNLYGFYYATIIAELLAVAVLASVMLREIDYSVAAFSPALFRAMLAFGIPMIGYELAGIVLNLGDRYVIQAMLGSGALGTYSAAYNLCDYVRTIVIASLGQAIVPMYVRVWEQHGEKETTRFLQQSMHVYLMVGFPVIAGLAAVGPEVLSLLASQKYSAGAVIIPYVIAGMIVEGMLVIFGAGLYIHKQTTKMMYLVAGCAVGNIVLNIVLVPVLGIMGAAVATLVSYAALAGLAALVGSKWLSLSFPWMSGAKFAVLSALMYLAIAPIHLYSNWRTVIAKVVAGALVYSVMTILADERARSALRIGLKRLGIGDE